MKFILISLICGLSCHINAQEAGPKQTFSLASGFYNAVYKDLHFSPLRYSTNSYATAFNYDRIKVKTNFTVTLISAFPI